MAIKLDAADTDLVLLALEYQRDMVSAHGYDSSPKLLVRLDRMIKSYRKSLTALERWEAK